jgi:hypothetical protein
MSRIRNVKPEFFRHEELQDLEAKHMGKYPMFVYEALWNQCDRQGVFPWKPRTLKLDILPFLPFDMEETLKILAGAGYIKKYTVDGKDYGIIPTFKKHQSISKAEQDNINVYPLPQDDCQTGEKPFENGLETDDEQSQDGFKTPEFGILNSEFGNLNSENGQTDGANAPCDFPDDPKKLFICLWQKNPDIFNLAGRIEKPKEWAAFWEKCPYPPDDIKRRMQNFIDGVKNGSIEKIFVPRTPDRFVLKGHLNTSDTPYKKDGNRGGVSPPLNLMDKKSLGGLE